NQCVSIECAAGSASICVGSSSSIASHNTPRSSTTLGLRARACDRRRVDAAPLSGFDPDTPDAWIVLADWLTERGDPRGLMLALEASGRDAAQLEQLRREHLHRYSEALWPVFGVRSEAELNERIELRWRAGLIVG